MLLVASGLFLSTPLLAGRTATSLDSASCSDCCPGSESGAGASPTYEFVVVDRDTGEPISGVEFHLNMRDRQLPPVGVPAASSDDRGRISAKWAPAATRRWVLFQKRGYGPRLVASSRGRSSEPELVRLARGARLGGTVRGAPPKSRVEVVFDAASLVEEFAFSGAPVSMFQRARIDGAGRFQFADLPPFALLDVRIVDADSGRCSLALPEPLTLQPGESHDVEWSLEELPTLRGVVRTSDGTPRPEVGLLLEGGVGSAVGQEGLLERRTMATTSGPDGTFEFASVPPGSWTLETDPESLDALRAEQLYGAPVQVPVWPGTEDVTAEFELHRALFIEGTVVDLDGRATAAAIRLPLDPHLALRPAFSDDRGRFRIGPLPPGRQILRASPFGVWEDAAGLTASDAYDVEAGDSDVQIRLNPGCALTTRVVDPETGQSVEARFFHASRTTQEGTGYVGTLAGSFEAEHNTPFLSPGTYVAYAMTADGRAGVLEDIELRAGDDRTVEVPVGPAGTLCIDVHSGAGLAVARVFAKDVPIARDILLAGCVRTLSLPPATYSVSVVALESTLPGGTPVSTEPVEVSIAAGERREVRFEVPGTH